MLYLSYLQYPKPTGQPGRVPNTWRNPTPSSPTSPAKGRRTGTSRTKDITTTRSTGAGDGQGLRSGAPRSDPRDPKMDPFGGPQSGPGLIQHELPYPHDTQMGQRTVEVEYPGTYSFMDRSPHHLANGVLTPIRESQMDHFEDPDPGHDPRPPNLGPPPDARDHQYPALSRC